MSVELKKLSESLAAAVLLVVLSPLLVGVVVAILLIDGRPVFFRQVRPGVNAKPFILIKFRTMAPASRVGAKIESERVTALGSFLRTTSLDELPSLWNIVLGKMSFVGPRPLLEEYLELYSQRHSRRHEVRPGLTGLAQVAGRNLVSWEERLDLDIAYVDNHSFWLDLKILAKTVHLVLSSRGINRADGTTMPRLPADYTVREQNTF